MQNDVSASFSLLLGCETVHRDTSAETAITATITIIIMIVTIVVITPKTVVHWLGLLLRI
jgi:hypothetical protein